MIELDKNKVVSYFGINMSDEQFDNCSVYAGLSVETFNGNGMMYNVLVVYNDKNVLNDLCSDSSEVLGIVSQKIIDLLKI